MKYESSPGCWSCVMIVTEPEELQRGREHRHISGLAENGNIKKEFLLTFIFRTFVFISVANAYRFSSLYNRTT